LITVSFGAQAIINVQGSDVFAAAELDCDVEQTDRISAAGEAYDDSLPGFKQATVANSPE